MTPLSIDRTRLFQEAVLLKVRIERSSDLPSDLAMHPIVRTTASLVAHFTGVSRLIAARYRGRGMIFALHSVVDDDAFCPDYTLRCPAGQLEWGLRWLRDEGVDFVSLDEGVRRLNGNNPRPFACFTF